MAHGGHREQEGYGRQRRSALGVGGTVAVHALLVGVFLMMPKQLIDKVFTPPITTTHIPLPPPPPEVEQKQEERRLPVERQNIPPMKVDPIIETLPPPVRIETGTEPVRIEPVLPGNRGSGTRPADPPPVPVLVEASIDPRALPAFQPDYPGSMLRMGMEGSVTVRVTISPQGRVVDIEKISATDDAFWIATQRHALRKWRFRPATRDGLAVQSSKQLTVRFTLTDR